MQRAWLIIEKTIAVIAIIGGLLLFLYWLAALADIAYFWWNRNNTSFEWEYGKLLLRSFPTTLFILMIPASGVLLLLNKKYGWIGTLISMLLTVISFMVVRYYNSPGFGEDAFQSDMNILYALLAAILFTLLLSKEIRGRYPTQLKHWLIYIGIIGILVLNVILIRLF